MKLVCKPREGVLACLGRNKGEFEMVIMRCSVSEPPAEELEKRQLEYGIPFWPHAFVTAHCDTDKLLQAWNNEYVVLGFGDHLYRELADFYEITGITALAL